MVLGKGGVGWSPPPKRGAERWVWGQSPPPKKGGLGGAGEAPSLEIPNSVTGSVMYFTSFPAFHHIFTPPPFYIQSVIIVRGLKRQQVAALTNFVGCFFSCSYFFFSLLRCWMTLLVPALDLWPEKHIPIPPKTPSFPTCPAKIVRGFKGLWFSPPVTPVSQRVPLA